MAIQSLLEEARISSRTQKRKWTWYRIVSAMACLTVFITTYALILPAITMDVDDAATCGMVDHRHSDECYEIIDVPDQRVLICGFAEDGTPLAEETLPDGAEPSSEGNAEPEADDDAGLSLSASLEEEPEVLLLGNAEPETLPEDLAPAEEVEALSDSVAPAGEIEALSEDAEPAGDMPVHVHTDACYQLIPAHQERGELICPLPEHEHDMNCFINPKLKSDYICGHPYEHTHIDRCYTDGVLTCTYTEHTHSYECLKLYPRLMKQFNDKIDEVLARAEETKGAEELADLSGELSSLYVTLDLAYYEEDELSRISEEEYEGLISVLDKGAMALRPKLLAATGDDTAMLMGTTSSNIGETLAHYDPSEPLNDTSWQIVSEGYAGNAVINKTLTYDLDNDGNDDIRLQKNVVPTETENLFKIYLSIDKAMSIKDLFDTASPAITTSHNYEIGNSEPKKNQANGPRSGNTVGGNASYTLTHDEEGGSLSYDVHFIVVQSYNQVEVVNYGGNNHTAYALKSGETAVYDYWDVRHGGTPNCSNGSGFLGWPDDASNLNGDFTFYVVATGVNFHEEDVGQGIPLDFCIVLDDLPIAASSYEILLDAVDDVLGPAVRLREDYGFQGNFQTTPTYDEDTRTIHWIPETNLLAQTKITYKPLSGWLENCAELCYTVELDPALIDSSGEKMNGETLETDEIALTNESALLSTTLIKRFMLKDENTDEIHYVTPENPDDPNDPAYTSGKYDIITTTPVPFQQPTVRGMRYNIHFTKIAEPEAGAGDDGVRKVLAGGLFELVSADGLTRFKATSDELGRVDFVDLPAGEYTLVELNAPSGYVKPATPVTTLELSYTANRNNMEWDVQPSGTDAVYLPSSTYRENETPKSDGSDYWISDNWRLKDLSESWGTDASGSLVLSASGETCVVEAPWNAIPSYATLTEEQQQLVAALQTKKELHDANDDEKRFPPLTFEEDSTLLAVEIPAQNAGWRYQNKPGKNCYLLLNKMGVEGKVETPLPEVCFTLSGGQYSKAPYTVDPLTLKTDSDGVGHVWGTHEGMALYDYYQSLGGYDPNPYSDLVLLEPNQIYTLNETQAANGYNSLPKGFSFRIKLEIQDGNVVPVLIEDPAFKSYFGFESSYDSDKELFCFSLTLYNSKGSEMPFTGGSGIKPFVIIGLAICAGALTTGLILLRRRERRSN